MAWEGVEPGGGSLRTAGNAWEALLAHWLRLSVGVCSMRRLQQFLGRAQWICRPRFGHSPHLSRVWAHVLWGPPPPAAYPPQFAALYVCGVCVLALPGWSVAPLMRVVRRQPVLVYVDAALDGGMYWLGLFSFELGSRSAAPPEQPPN